MRPQLFDTKEIYNYLKLNRIASINDLKKALGTNADKTVLRKLKQLSYLSSYSHRGAYYTLSEIADFDENDLWAYNGVMFSKYGTLLNTACHFVKNSSAGYCVKELDKILHVSTKKALLYLFKKNSIYREKLSGVFYYFSANKAFYKKQLRLQEVKLETLPSIVAIKQSKQILQEVKEPIKLFFSTLNEKQRRLYAGMESIKLGHGGDRKISETLGMNVHTVARGRQNLLSNDIEPARIRKKGGGRKAIKKKALKSQIK